MTRALAIDIAHPSALLARGYYYYYGFRNYDRALEDFEVALEAVPNDSEARASIGFIHRRQGKWDEALADLQAAYTLAPREAPLLNAVAELRRARREFDEAIEVRRRIAELGPENVQNVLALAGLAIETTGDPARGMELWRKVPPSDGFWYFAGWAIMSAWNHDFDRAHEWAGKIRGETPFIRAARAVLQASFEAERDGVESARPSFQSVAGMLEAFLEEAPANADLRMWLGLTHAMLGNADAAIREGRLAIDLTAKDRFLGPKAEEALAQIYSRLGRTDDAIDLIERLLQTTYDNALTVTNLRLDRRWDPIRNDPRFQALLTPSI
jgi:tetratricopeptide (TPR) repeat protein